MVAVKQKTKRLRMSAVPVEKPIIVTQPRVQPRPQLRIEQGAAAKASTGSTAMAKCVSFVMLAFCFFFVSSLSGQVMVEKARREGLRAVERARAATKEESLLRDRVQSMTRAYAIDDWAQENGFVAPEALAKAQEKADAKETH